MTTPQLLAVHTFVTALWKVGLEARGFALFLVFLACLFVVLWVSIGTAHHKNYEMPTPVCYLTLFFPTSCSPLTLLGVSIGAGSALVTWANALVVNTSGCGWHYSHR